MRLQVGFGYYLGCLCRGQDCICEELLDQVGIVRCQESGQRLLDLILHSVHDLFDFFLLVKLLSNQFEY